MTSIGSVPGGAQTDVQVHRLGALIAEGGIEPPSRCRARRHHLAEPIGRCSDRTVTTGRSTVEQFVPEDRPSTRQSVASACSHDQPRHQSHRPWPADEPPVQSGGDPVIRKVVNRRAWLGSAVLLGRARTGAASAAQRPLHIAWAIPSPCRGFTRPAASPTRSTRPAAGTVPIMPILSQPPRRRAGIELDASPRSSISRRCSRKRGMACWTFAPALRSAIVPRPSPTFAPPVGPGKTHP